MYFTEYKISAFQLQRLILIMRSNEQGKEFDSEHLLIWASTFITADIHYFSIDDLPQNVLMTVLDGVDSQFFEKREADMLSTLETYSRLELYLEEVLGKTFRRRRFAPSAYNVYSLLLYICVHCQNSKTFISEIMKLETGTQVSLMKIIEEMGKMMGNIVEINQVLEKVGEFQEENEQLRNKVGEMCEDLKELEERIGVIQQEYRELENQCDRYKRQRNDVLRQLNFIEFADYLQLIRDMQSERSQLLKTIQHLEQNNSELQKDKYEYKAKIIEDSMFIKDLSEEVNRFKGMYKSMKLSSSCASFQLPLTTRNKCRFSIDRQMPIQNQNENLPCRSARSVYDDETVASDDYLKIKNEYETVKEEYEFLKERSAEQKQEIKDLKRMARKHRDKSRMLQEQVNELKSLQDGLRASLRPFQQTI